MNISSLEKGDKVKWQSAAGTLIGTISEIYLAHNGNEILIPWILIELKKVGDTVPHYVQLCGTHEYLKMLYMEKVE